MYNCLLYLLSLNVFSCAHQEPGTNAEIKEFATGKYGVTFDMFAKLNVNGSNADPLWDYLKNKQGGLLGKLVLSCPLHHMVLKGPRACTMRASHRLLCCYDCKFDVHDI